MIKSLDLGWGRVLGMKVCHVINPIPLLQLLPFWQSLILTTWLLEYFFLLVISKKQLNFMFKTWNPLVYRILDYCCNLQTRLRCSTMKMLKFAIKFMDICSVFKNTDRMWWFNVLLKPSRIWLLLVWKKITISISKGKFSKK